MAIYQKDIQKFRSLLRQFERIVNTHSKNCCLNVSMAQCHVLLQINIDNNSTTNELSKKLNLDTSTISRTVDNLVKSNLVLRSENPNDRRSLNLNLTSDGIKLCNAINKDADDLYAKVLRNIEEKKQKSVINNFELLVKALIENVEYKEKNSDCCG